MFDGCSVVSGTTGGLTGVGVISSGGEAREIGDGITGGRLARSRLSTIATVNKRFFVMAQTSETGHDV